MHCGRFARPFRRAFALRAELAVAYARAADGKVLIAHQALRIAKLERQVYGQKSKRGTLAGASTLKVKKPAYRRHLELAILAGRYDTIKALKPPTITRRKLRPPSHQVEVAWTNCLIDAY